MVYIGYTFKISPTAPGCEILIAELADAGFESFVENKNGISAYISKDNWDESILKDIRVLRSKAFKVSYSFKEIKQRNWNSVWEKNFNPITIDDKVCIRAPFHKKFAHVDYDIIIEPKMSFGTGHHETTYIMVQHILTLNLKGKRVLDMGCGTGVLAILAEKRNARFIDAIDIDAWCYENSIENIKRNNCHKIKAYQGDASLLKDKNYDIVIANINRNILLNDIKIYASCLSKNGILMLSGFYVKDIVVIEAEAKKYGLFKVNYKQKNNWVGVKFVKK